MSTLKQYYLTSNFQKNVLLDTNSIVFRCWKGTQHVLPKKLFVTMFSTVPQLANSALEPIFTFFVNLMCAVVRSTIEGIMATHSKVI